LSTATAAARNRGHPQPAQKLVFCNSNLDISTTVCKIGDLEVFPKAFLEHLTGVYLLGVSHGRVPHGNPPRVSHTSAAKAAEFGLGTADTRLFTLGFLIEE
jgi:hypothetical protein